jgi:transposase
MYKKAHNIPTKVQRLSSLNEPLDVEVKRLRRELKIAKQERDILKKATAYFAKETL